MFLNEVEFNRRKDRLRNQIDELIELVNENHMVSSRLRGAVVRARSEGQYVPPGAEESLEHGGNRTQELIKQLSSIAKNPEGKNYFLQILNKFGDKTGKINACKWAEAVLAGSFPKFPAG